MNDEPDVLAETENYFAWISQDEEGDKVYHLELGGVSLHMMADEWEELVLLIKSVP